MTPTTKEDRVRALETAIDRAGGIIRFSKAMNITHQAVYNWKRRGWVPATQALMIEAIFAVPRAELMGPSLAAVLTTPPITHDDIL